MLWIYIRREGEGNECLSNELKTPWNAALTFNYDRIWATAFDWHKIRGRGLDLSIPLESTFFPCTPKKIVAHNYCLPLASLAGTFALTLPTIGANVFASRILQWNQSSCLKISKNLNAWLPWWWLLEQLPFLTIITEHAAFVFFFAPPIEIEMLPYIENNLVQMLGCNADQIRLNATVLLCWQAIY